MKYTIKKVMNNTSYNIQSGWASNQLITIPKVYNGQQYVFPGILVQKIVEENKTIVVILGRFHNTCMEVLFKYSSVLTLQRTFVDENKLEKINITNV